MNTAQDKITVNKSSDLLRLLWAKKGERDGSMLWLPLSVHLNDTMMVMGQLWNHWLSKGQRRYIVRAMQNADGTCVAEDAAIRTARFLGLIHDIGKATPAFQTQKGFANPEDLDKLLLERLECAGLVGISSLQLVNPKKTHHTIAGEFLLVNRGVRKDIASIVGAHHGKPIDTEDELEEQFAYEANYWQEDKANGAVKSIWETLQCTLLDEALIRCGFVSETGRPDAGRLPKITESGQVLFSGLLIMADWIASNENYFPLIPIDSISAGDGMIRLMCGWEKWMHDEPLEISEIRSAEDIFRAHFGFEPRPFQEAVYESVSEINDPGIMILEAPMGVGKTEAALGAAEILMEKAGLGGIFFGLPTQATSNGIFPRVEDWLEHVVQECEQTSTLKLMHGKAALNDLQGELSRGEHVDEDGNGGVYTAGWFAGRKTSILSDAVVGTVDQFLLTALKQKHLALRHLGFSRKVIIIDEVHAYDAYMSVYLGRALQWMGAYGIPVIMLSATLPSDKRKEFIKAYLTGRGVKTKELTAYESFFASEGYPLLTYTDGQSVLQKNIAETAENSVVSVIRINEEELSSELQNLLKDGGVAGVVVNTVSRAQEIAKHCISIFGDDVLLMHSHFIDTDRVQKEKKLIRAIGRNGKRPRRLVVVGTQVLEQSLDIDFDVLFTDLCPMDLLLQRIGRLHRHRIGRPARLKEPMVYVMGESAELEFEKGSSAVYGDYYMARTQHELPDELYLPADISKLTQRVYQNKELNWPDHLRAKCNINKREHFAKLEKKKSKAEGFLLGKPLFRLDPDKNNLIGWLRTPSEAESEERAYAQVRDTSETIEVIALIRCGDGYGYFGDQIDISEMIDDPQVAKGVALNTLRLSQSIILSAYKSTQLAIEALEEYNKKYLSSWQPLPWLKGSLGIIFEPDGTFKFGKIRLQYDLQMGLRIAYNQ